MVWTYFAPESQLLFLLALCDFFLCELLAGYFALVEAGEVFFASGGVKFDLLGSCHCDFALLGGWRHGWRGVCGRLAACYCGVAVVVRVLVELVKRRI